MSITQTHDRPELVVEDHTEPGGNAAGQPGDPQTAVPELRPRVVGPRPSFTITEAATACAVSRKTITRKLADLAGHGAAKDEDGIWRIPVEALLAVGLHPGRSLNLPARPGGPIPEGPTVPSPAPSTPSPDLVTIPRERWDDVRLRLARAEAEAAERALALADARLALRALTAAPVPAPPAPSAPAPTAPAPASPVALGPGATPAATPGPAAPDSSDTRAAPNEAVAHPHLGTAAPPAVRSDGEPAPDSLATARQQAARTGGYVPPVGSAPRKRRWWQSK